MGTRVNLERALRLGDRLGGHWVQGHVDAVSTVLERRAEGGSLVMRCSLPAELAPFFVEKGSVCIDGVSLTLSAVEASGFAVMLIPETQQRTSLGRKQVGQRVNLEADIIGKYVARMVGARGGLTLEQLEAAGLAAIGRRSMLSSVAPAAARDMRVEAMPTHEPGAQHRPGAEGHRRHPQRNGLLTDDEDRENKATLVMA